MALQSDFGERTINELQLMFRNGQINLQPGFRRKFVWTWHDRRRLIQSIVSKYTLPGIFLRKRNSRGRLVYDVIDGKQRLETIFGSAREFDGVCSSRGFPENDKFGPGHRHALSLE